MSNVQKLKPNLDKPKIPPKESLRGKQVLVIAILNFADPKDSYGKASLRENFICFLIFFIWDLIMN